MRHRGNLPENKDRQDGPNTGTGSRAARWFRRSRARPLLGLVATVAAAGALLAGTVVAIGPFAGEITEATSNVPEEIDLAALDDFAIRSHVYGSDGSLLTTLHGPENREPVPLSRVPQPVIDAVLAVEDADFYEHNGVNFRAMARAFFENVQAGGIAQGGSTVTQQLVKNALLSAERELERKKKEIPLALRLERELSKEEILESYLNTVYFGSGAYGVQAAAETYWGRDVADLGYAEGALLASLIANPVGHDPTLYPDRAYEQRRLALERLVSLGTISREQASEYRGAPLPVRRCAADETSPLTCGDADVAAPDDYFVEEVKQQLLDDPRLGATRDERITTLFSGGLHIHTTLDPAAQWAAEVTAATVPPPNDRGVTSALVSLDNRSGAVRALVGGPGYDTYKYDVVTHEPGRQTGSAFKTVVVLTALEQGNFPFDRIQGGGSFACPLCEEDPYRISGAGGTLASVTAGSSNGAFVRMGQVVGLDNVVEMARRLGLANDQMDPNALSMPLGTFDMTPLEMATAYAAIANDGLRVEPYMVERVEDREGNTIIEHEGASPRRVFSEATACYATEILGEVVRSGTGTRARLTEMPSAGKTGTTDRNADAWFIGFTPYLTTAVWMGNPDTNTVSMDNIGGVRNYGGTFPAMIWRGFNQSVHHGLEPTPFPRCEAPDRSARNLYGEGNNFLNGFRFPSSGSSSPSRPRTPPTTSPSGRGPGPSGPTTTVPTDGERAAPAPPGQGAGGTGGPPGPGGG
jgi:penicillin-binding protein 1A